MQVLKFGGTSVGSAKNIGKVVDILKKQYQNEKVLVVISAMAGVTNKLFQIAQDALENKNSIHPDLHEISQLHIKVIHNSIAKSKQNQLIGKVEQIFAELEETLLGVRLVKELSDKVLDKIIVKGEILASLIIYEIIRHEFKNVIYLDASEFITCSNRNGSVHVNFKESYKRIQSLNRKNFKMAVVPGFIASEKNGDITNLGRGGSDYTASIFAVGLNAERLVIWTDVDGVFSADPKLVKQAYPIKELSYQEAMELSHFGAKVIYPPTLHPVFSHNIDLYVKNTFNPKAGGTHICQKTSINGKLIKGISSISEICLITLSGSGMVGISGFSTRLFAALATVNVNVILISQASSEHSICVAIPQCDTEIAVNAIRDEFVYEMSVLKVDDAVVEKDLAIIAIVGEKMNKTIGISGKAFNAMGKNGINIHAIAQGGSELNISFVIRKQNVKKALNVLHEEFFLTEKKRINLYIAGVGNVGTKLIELLQSQHEFLLKEKNLEIKIKGIINSKKMTITDEADFLNNYTAELSQGEESNLNQFIAKVKHNNLRNSIFVDNTASQEVSDLYDKFLEANISVVTCNKIAASSAMLNYVFLKDLARKNKVQFLYESNVGAGLPIIRTINNLKATGDNILKIEAVLSGSLNYIFNEFHEGSSFRKAVEMAMEAGFTEPDPRVDLSGMDVARKILILARESGYFMELQDVKVKPIIPDKIFEKDSLDSFLECLDEYKGYFSAMLKNAMDKECKLRVVSTFENNRAVISLKQVSKQSPFYHIEGKDNVVVLTTAWYNKQPLIIKGAGAGAEVTASGIMSDIISISNT